MVDLLSLKSTSGVITKDSAQNNFVQDSLHILGDVRALYVFEAFGTTLTDKTLNQQVLTWSEDVADFDTSPNSLGLGTTITFNGTDEYGTVPDADNLSFGDSSQDQPFSLIALFNDAGVGAGTLIAKWTPNREYRISTDSSRNVNFHLFDQSITAQIGRATTTPITSDSWILVSGTYDGSRTIDGIKIYFNTDRVDNIDNISGTYTAMENNTTDVTIGCRFDAGLNPVGFLNGQMALVGIVAKELLIDEIWAFKQLVNSYYNLSL